MAAFAAEYAISGSPDAVLEAPEESRIIRPPEGMYFDDSRARANGVHASAVILAHVFRSTSKSADEGC